jgi:hypothetical protein
MIPIYIANPGPFRLVIRDKKDEYLTTLEELNKSKYNYVKLHRASKFFYANIASKSPVGIGYDGSFFLMADNEYSTIDKTVDEFNKIFACILIGGVYIEAVSPSDLAHGDLHTCGYFRHTKTFGINAELHRSLGNLDAGITNNLLLLDAPSILGSEIIEAYKKGELLLRKISNLSTSLFISGFSYFLSHQLREALTHSWISIEQMLEHIWDVLIVQESKLINIPKRSTFLMSQQWSAAHKIELLFQKKAFNEDIYIKLSDARTSRNKFIHDGKSPEFESVRNALFGLIDLIQIASSLNGIEFRRENLDKYLAINNTSTPKRGVAKSSNDVDWSKELIYKILPFIPGDKFWDGDYETFEDITIEPILKDPQVP